MNEPDLRFFTETFDVLYARPFKNLVRDGVYGFDHNIIGFDSLGTPSPPGGGPSAFVPTRTFSETGSFGGPE